MSVVDIDSDNSLAVAAVVVLVCEGRVFVVGTVSYILPPHMVVVLLVLGSDDYNYYFERVGLNTVTVDRYILDSHC